jgi:mannosyltransferase OCH1-like enzyme
MRIPGTIIPAKIHQVQIHDEPMIFSLTDFFRHFYNKRFMKAWSYNNPDFEYYLWTDDTAATFVKGICDY